MKKPETQKILLIFILLLLVPFPGHPLSLRPVPAFELNEILDTGVRFIFGRAGQQLHHSFISFTCDQHAAIGHHRQTKDERMPFVRRARGIGGCAAGPPDETAGPHSVKALLLFVVVGGD